MEILEVPVAMLTSIFSPIPLIAPPPFGRDMLGAMGMNADCSGASIPKPDTDSFPPDCCPESSLEEVFLLLNAIIAFVSRRLSLGTLVYELVGQDTVATIRMLMCEVSDVTKHHLQCNAHDSTMIRTTSHPALAPSG